MKTLYFYSDINDAPTSDAFRARLQADGLTFTELKLGLDGRRHNVSNPGIQAVIDVDGATFKEIAEKADVATAWSAAPTSLPAPPGPLINPLITRAQATNTLKNLLETNPTTWTATQERQAMYLILLFAFRDFQNGIVY